MNGYPELSTLCVTREDRIVFVTIDNPPINLMDRAMLRDLRKLLEALEQDEVTRVVVFRSANPEFFIAHLDLTLVAKGLEAPPSKATTLGSLHAMFEGYRSLGKATVAVLEGRAIGAGIEFALSLDMRFAAQGRASIGHFEVALGCLPGGTGTQRLPALGSRARALEMILGCDEIDAATAELYGFVNRIFPPAEIGPFVDRLARRIASFPSAAIALAKRAVDAAAPNPVPGLLEENYLAGQLMASSEAKRRFATILARGAQTPEFEREIFSRLQELGEVE